MRVLVTGGSGFIGSALVRQLLSAGHQVLNVDALTYAANPLSLTDIEADENYSFAHVNICDGDSLSALFSGFAPDAVMNLAAESHVDRSIDDPAPFLTTNVTGTGVLLDVTYKYWKNLPGQDKADFRFLHVSTDEVYGDLPAEAAPFTEDSPYRPSSPYAASKAASDHLVRSYHRTFFLPVIITNCTNNYGPRQFPEKFIPLFILRALDDDKMPLYGDGFQKRDWLHVEDHARALILILEKGRHGATYNIGARCERRNKDVAYAIKDLIGAGTIARIKDRPGHDRRYAIDPSLLEFELGWTPKYDFDSGLKATIQWYKDNPDWVAAARERYDGARLGTG